MEAYFERINLIPSDALVLDLSQTGIYFENEKTAYQNGSFKLSSNNIYWQDSEIIWKLHLSQIDSAESLQGFITSSPKLILNCRKRQRNFEWTCDICSQVNTNTLKCSNCGVMTTRTLPCPGCTFLNHKDLLACELCNTPLTNEHDKLAVIKISFRGTNQPINQILTTLQQTLGQKSWVSLPSPTKPGVGVSGILKNIQENQERRKDLVSQDSFQDLESLMEKAGEMTKLADLLTAKLASGSQDDTVTFQQDLQDLGISQPVTRHSGGKYDIELAKELSKFLDVYSTRTGNTQIPLSDAFCVFNRARGVALVSPEDLYRAAVQLDNLDLSFRLRKFQSGVKVLEPKSVTDQFIADKVNELLKGRTNGMSALEFSFISKVSVLVAQEHLLLVEKMGLLCRDDSLESLRFYPNRFI